MIPLVLGGIALAAVGYGVKEYCESDGCPWDDEPVRRPAQKRNMFETLHQSKITVHDTRFKLLHEHLSKIQNLKGMPLDIWDDILTEEKLLSNDLTNEIKVYVDLYAELLHESNSVLEIYTEKTKEIMQTSLDYKDYDKENKKSLKKIYKFMKEIQDIFSLKLLDDNKAIKIESISSLRVYRDMVKKRYKKCVDKVTVSMS